MGGKKKDDAREVFQIMIDRNSIQLEYFIFKIRKINILMLTDTYFPIFTSNICRKDLTLNYEVFHNFVWFLCPDFERNLEASNDIFSQSIYILDTLI